MDRGAHGLQSIGARSQTCLSEKHTQLETCVPGEDGEMQDTELRMGKQAGPAGAFPHCKQGHKRWDCLHPHLKRPFRAQGRAEWRGCHFQTNIF